MRPHGFPRSVRSRRAERPAAAIQGPSLRCNGINSQGEKETGSINVPLAETFDEADIVAVRVEATMSGRDAGITVEMKLTAQPEPGVGFRRLEARGVSEDDK